MPWVTKIRVWWVMTFDNENLKLYFGKLDHTKKRYELAYVMNSCWVVSGEKGEMCLACLVSGVVENEYKQHGMST